MRLILQRHTRVGVPQGQCYGQTDVDLATSFEDEAEVVCRRLVAFGQSKILSSPLKRCRLLAEKLQAWSQVDSIVIDDRLKELNFGLWEGQLWEMIPRAELDHWLGDFAKRSPPEGESFSELRDRVVKFLDHLTIRHATFQGSMVDQRNEPGPQTVVLITHAGVIRAILCEALGMPLNNAFRIKLDYGSTSSLTFDDGNWSVELVNKI